MENLIWLIAIGALFFFMMRKGGGCCCGHSHGGHKKESTHKHTPDSGGKEDKKASCH